MKHSSLKSIILFTSLTLAMVSSVQAAGKSSELRHSKIKAGVIFNWSPATATAKVTFYTGCRSAAAGSVSNNFTTSLDKVSNTLKLDGSFINTWKPRLSRIMPRDCMGSRTEIIKIKINSAGFYKIMHNGEKLWLVELADKPIALKISRYRMGTVRAVPWKPQVMN